VLAKNKNGALPLGGGKKLGSIAVIGGDAGPAHNSANFYSDHAGYDGVVAVGFAMLDLYVASIITVTWILCDRARLDRAVAFDAPG